MKLNTKYKSCVTVFIIFPILIIQRTDTSLFEPSSYTVVMESVVAYSPGNDAFFGGLGIGVRLAIDTGLHDMTFADSAVFNLNIPRP